MSTDAQWYAYLEHRQGYWLCEAHDIELEEFEECVHCLEDEDVTDEYEE